MNNHVIQAGKAASRPIVNEYIKFIATYLPFRCILYKVLRRYEEFSKVKCINLINISNLRHLSQSNFVRSFLHQSKRYLRECLTSYCVALYIKI